MSMIGFVNGNVSMTTSYCNVHCNVKYAKGYYSYLGKNVKYDLFVPSIIIWSNIVRES